MNTKFKYIENPTKAIKEVKERDKMLLDQQLEKNRKKLKQKRKYYKKGSKKYNEVCKEWFKEVQRRFKYKEE